ncbi:polyisoprenoid-binding protein [Aureimonas endophytica]|uniref:Polyisoprenoid-binding protein n=1 Tax=Aureimonas endophytica TaxID=2027858 RepID=A0A916ZQB5_9HYPH|nr:YceI family protein [Aureimonas endophytica]GGE09052.1 polyisoprenoid-binding protein [Aureimonas endophytica]
MRKFLPILAAALALAGLPALAASHAGAEPRSWRIDPASRIAFTVDQVGGGGISGAFPAFDGRFEIDPDDLARSSVAITLHPASVTTGQGRVDAFLRSSAVFDAADYPDITFRSTRVVPDGPKGARIEGVLTARGKARNETFHASLVERSDAAVSFRVTGDIYRSPYGMGVGTPIYSNVVAFDMVLKGAR